MALNSLANIKTALKPGVSYSKAFSSNSANTNGGMHTSWGTSTGSSNIDLWGAGVWDTTLNGVNLTKPTTGQMPFPERPTSGDIYIATAKMLSVGAPLECGMFIIADRIWHNGGIDRTNVSTAQSITTPTFPARDNNGSSNGEGYFLAAEVSVANSGGTNNTITVSYTNSNNVSGRTSTNINATTSNGLVQRMWPMSLQAGDTGIKSIQSVTLGGTAHTAGTTNLVVYRPLVYIPFASFACNAWTLDPVSLQMPNIPRDAVPFAMGFNGTSNAGAFGTLSLRLIPAYE